MPKPTLDSKVTITNKESYLFGKCGIIISINKENNTFEVVFSPEDYIYLTVDKSCSEEFRLDEIRVHKKRLLKINIIKKTDEAFNEAFSF